MRIKLCYKEYELGLLTKEGNEYVFTPISGLELAKSKYIVPRASKLLSGGVKRSSELFGEYAYFLKLLDNAYVRSEANVMKEDTVDEKLQKIAKLRLDKGSFYLKQG